MIHNFIVLLILLFLPLFLPLFMQQQSLVNIKRLLLLHFDYIKLLWQFLELADILINGDLPFDIITYSFI